MNTFILGLHVLLATMLVGPQFLLFLAVVPATWLIPDEALRRNVTRVVTQRFGWIAGVAIVGLVLTGIYQLNSSLVSPDIRAHMSDTRFGSIFALKMLTFLALIIAIGVHGFVFGRRIRLVSEAVERGEAQPDALEAARRNSLLFTMIILALSIVLVFLGVALAESAG